MDSNRVVVEVEMHQNYIIDAKNQEQCDNTDIRNAVIDESSLPKPLYLPPRVTISQKSYGKLYDYLYFDLSTGKMNEDPTINVLMAPPSGYSNTNDGRILRRLCERKVLKFEKGSQMPYIGGQTIQWRNEKATFFSAQ